MAERQPRAVADIAGPDRDSIAESIRSSAPALKVWNASPDWLEHEAFGIMYHIPPNIDGYEEVDHPKFNDKDGFPIRVKADGILQVKDRFGVIRGRRMLCDNAFDIVIHIVENLGIRGVTYLSGDVIKDQQRMKQAIQKYRSWQRANAEQILDAWSQQVRNFIANPSNKGRTPPRQPERVRRAQEFRDALLQDEAANFKYVCQYDFYGTNDKPTYLRHMRVSHNEQPEDVQLIDDSAPGKKKGKKPKAEATAP